MPTKHRQRPKPEHAIEKGLLFDTDEVEYLIAQLADDDEDFCEAAMARLAWLGDAGLLAIINALNNDSPRVRRLARIYFYATYRGQSFLPKVSKGLESNHSKVRLEAIEEIVKVLPDVKNAIDARHIGWESLAKWLPNHEPMQHGANKTPQAVKEDDVERMKNPIARSGPKKPKKGQPQETQPKWRWPLSAYRNLQRLVFVNDQELDKAIQLLWTDELIDLPHSTPDGKSLVIPVEAVECFASAGLKFSAEKLLSRREMTAR